MEIIILCNEKGTGKTTYVQKHYTPFQYFTKDTIENACLKIDLQFSYCIIDSVDSIPEPLFKNNINKIISLNWKAIIFIFDIIKNELANCTNFNMIWESGMISKNYKYSNFIASKEEIYSYLQKYYSELDKSCYDNIIDITTYNFKKIDRLMLLNSIQNNNGNEISIKALVKYIDEIIKDKYKDIPDADILLKKASIIGKQFTCDILESPAGFGCKTASDYLKKMEELHGFIRNCINMNTQYEFVCDDIYRGIFEGITDTNKISWIKILIQYYKTQYQNCFNTSEQLVILNKLNNFYKLLPSYNTIERKSICFLLFYKNRLCKKTYYALECAKEIIEDLPSVINPVELAFIQNYRIKTLMELGEYQKALEILQSVHNLKKYPGSKMFIKYYYAYNLFQTGNIDLSYTIVLEIIDYLKVTSGSNKHSQELFCMTYSLMSTLQNHLGLADNGTRYFALALNNANTKLTDKTFYYDILRKCDMFYEYEQIKENFKKCIYFYEQNNNRNSAGEVYSNLATEIMFQDGADPDVIKIYLQKAMLYFSEYPNEKLAYIKNNYGLYLVMIENNIEEGLKYFKEALLVGLSNFSYMSIYLNICMCYILLDTIENNDEFLDAHTHFILAKKKLEQRQNKSKYEDIYEILLQIIIDEHQGKNVEVLCSKARDLLDNNDFFIPLLEDIDKRNRQISDSFYLNNHFYYMRMNQLRCFFVEFKFWE